MARHWGNGAFFDYNVSESATHYTIAIWGYLYLAPPKSSNGSYPVYWSGYWGSGGNTVNRQFNMNGYGDSSLIASGTYAIPKAYGTTQSVSFAISGTHYWGNGDATATFTIPARAYAAPRPPLNPAVVRNSDTQATVTWAANYDGSSGAQPWTGVYVDRWSMILNTWVQVASLSWNVTSWVDKSIKGNDRYQYRIKSYNGTGNSTNATTGYIATTPMKPSGVVATKLTNLNIRVDWTNQATYQTGSKVYDNGTLVAMLGVGVNTWEHVSPSTSITHTYTVIAIADTLESELSEPSNTVQLQAPPNAPLNVVFTKSVYGSETQRAAIMLNWVHNPVDSSVQTAYQARIRKVGETTWRNATKKTSEVANTTPNELGTIVNTYWAMAPGQYEGQVMTWGAHATGSPWSASAVFTIENDPTVAINNPTPGLVVNRSRVTAQWAYNQAQGRPQQSIDMGIFLTSNLYEPLWVNTITGSMGEYEIPYTLLDDTNYTLSARVTSTNGLSSPIQAIQFSVDYLEPAKPFLGGRFLDDIGGNELTFSNDNNPIPTEFNRVYRCVNQDSPWMEVNTEIPLPELTMNRAPYPLGPLANSVAGWTPRFGSTDVSWSDDRLLWNDASFLHSTTIPATPGETVRVSVLIQVDAGLPPALYLSTGSPQFGGTPLPGGVTGHTEGGEQLLTVIGVVPVGITEINIITGSMTANSTVLTLREVMVGDGPFFDGSVASGYDENGFWNEYGWQGGENSSPSTKTYSYPPIMGEDWEYVGEFPQNSSIIDFEGVTNGITVYRVEAVSEIPSSSYGYYSIPANSQETWIGVGEDYSQTASMFYRLRASETISDIGAQAHYFDGRKFPVLISTNQIERTTEVSGTLDPTGGKGSLYQRFVNLALQPGPKLHRNKDGERKYVKLDSLTHDRQSTKMRHISYSITEIDKNG